MDAMSITDCGVINLGTALVCLGLGAGFALFWAFKVFGTTPPREKR